MHGRSFRGIFPGALLLLLLTMPLLLSCRQESIPLIEEKCGTCHSASIVYETRRSEAGWRQIMHGMKVRGLVISEEEEQRVFDILLTDFVLEQ